MVDETTHREHELDALMQASLGDIHGEGDEGDWFQNVTKRLEKLSIPPSHPSQYASTISTLHEIIEEAIKKQEEGEDSAEKVLVAVAMRQEEVFGGVVEWERLELGRLEEVVKEVGVAVGGVLPTGGYVNREKQLHSLQEQDQILTKCSRELDDILSIPLPIDLPLSSSSPSLEDEESSHTPTIIREAYNLQSNAQMLQLNLQSTVETLTDKLEIFTDTLKQEKDRFLLELDDVEKWLSEVYNVLHREPQRDNVEPYSIVEVKSLQEEYSEEGVNNSNNNNPAEDLTLSEGVKLDEEEVVVTYSIHREVSISGSSLGSDMVDMVEPEVLESSVDVDLEDEEYEKEVLQRVLSGSSSPSPSPSPIGTTEEQIRQRDDPFGDPVDPVGEQWVETMDEEEEETDVATETASVSSGSTLREVPNPSPDSKAVEFSEEEVKDEEEEEEEKEAVGGGGGGERGKSLADELGELGYELEEEISGERVKSDEEESDESGGGESVSDEEEGSEVSSEGAGLHWVARLRLLPMYCGIRGVGRGEKEEEEVVVHSDPCFYDIDHILEQLENHSGQLQSRNHKIKSAMANINFIITASSADLAQQLQGRLVKVKVQWEPLALRLRQRREQLLFEKNQTEALETLHEAVKELESQPQTNLTYCEVEDYYGQLMEFFQNVDSFEEQSLVHISQLESTMQPLLGQREGLLGDGKGMRRLLETIVENIREGYKRVEDQLRLQKQMLEQWREEWSTFRSALSLFQDWMTHAEGVVSRDCYGNDVREVEKYLKSIKVLHGSIAEEEKKVEKLVDLGNVLLVSVGKGTSAEAEVDLTLTDSETRWYNLVEKVESQESAINKVLISWRAYSTIYHAARSFISQLTKIVGTEPVESSHGNTSLLPSYRTYSDQVKAMQIQYDKLMEYSKELTDNPMVGGRDSIAMETRELQSDWERLKDNVTDSLSLLQREYDDWVHHQLQKMAGLVKKMGEIVARETRYVERMPLDTILEENTETLLEEAQNLVLCQDELTQLEEECVTVDKALLERVSEGRGGSSFNRESDSPRNTEYHIQQQAARDRYQVISEALLPVINIFFLQLQLLQKIHQGHKVVGMAIETAGSRTELENLLTDLNLTMSEDHFEQLRGDAYDLGTVTEDCGELEESHGVSLPPYEKLVQINRSLTGEIETLSEEASTAKVRLQLFIEWWVEFHGNHGDITSWLDEAESCLDTMDQSDEREESYETPNTSPVEMLNLAQKLEEEMKEKEVLFYALRSTGRNISEEFSHGARGDEEEEEEHEEEKEKEKEEEDEVNDCGVTDQLREIEKRWNNVKKRLQLKLSLYQDTSSKFNSFLTRFTSFCDWLCNIHDQLVELCEAVPHRASDDVISVHKNRLQEFQNEVGNRKNELDQLQSDGGHWRHHLVPGETLDKLRFDDSLPGSPVATETSESTDETDSLDREHLLKLPFLRKKIVAMTTKWGGVQRLLSDRASQLELSMDSLKVFLERADQLLVWMRERKKRECCASSGMPANITRLQQLLADLNKMEEDMKEQLGKKNQLIESGENLIGQLSGTVATTVTATVEEIRLKWAELEITVATRTKELAELLKSVEVLLVRVGECEGVVEEGEGRMRECGPIGADPDRLTQQQVILDKLDEELMEKKKVPEDLVAEAMNIISGCGQEESGAELREKVENLQNRFGQLCESCYENKELCEEARSDIQSYQKEEKKFLTWLSEVNKKLEERVETKKPIGTIHSETEDFFDYVKELEQHTEEYGQLRCHGNRLAAKYKPSNALDKMMSSLHHQWEEFVSKLFGHCKKLHGLRQMWDKFEEEVNNLLNWIMSEADRFSGEVTGGGEKGVVDHIDSCKTLSETLESKKKEVEEIQKLADHLREEDGEKPNGTCDVDSRWNDVNQHWSSLCKLLMETLIRLEATYAELQHVLMIRSDEFDWLTHCEREASQQHCCHGDVGRVDEEIVRHEQLLSEVEGHDKEVEFIQMTVEFLLEHTRLSEREEIKDKAAEFCRRYDDLLNSLKTYVEHMKKSIPLWNDFNAISQELGEWLDHAHLQLNSDLTQPGNAIVTETSLRNVELLLEELAGHEGTTLPTLTSLSSDLLDLTISGDQDYVTGMRDELVERTRDIAERTRERSETLIFRLQSWQVFPVAEAQAVHEFLAQVQMAVGGGEREGEEEEGDGREEEREISYEELEEKLRRLEELQRLQQASQEKLSTITHSVESPEVQAALQKNPDISKERSNLLQGWSSCSEALTHRIADMRARAEMMKQFQTTLTRLNQCLTELTNEVEMPLPPSPQLESHHKEILRKQTSLCERCEREVTGLNNLFDRFSTTSAGPEIPTSISSRSDVARKKFQVVSEKAQRRAEVVAKQLKSWAELKVLLPRLFSWLRTSLSELSALKKIPEFATEFSSLEGRLENLKEEMAEKKEFIERLQTLAADHLTPSSPSSPSSSSKGDDHSTKEMKKKFSRVEENWKVLNEGVESLTVAMAPWKELTDRYDELHDWFDQFRERVRRDLSDLEQEEENSANMADYIVALKDHLLKIEEQGEAVTRLTNQSGELLSHDVCSKYRPAAELKDQVLELEEMMVGQEQLIRHTLTDVEEKEAEWKRKAVSSIEEVSHLSLRLSSKDHSLQDKEREIMRQRAEIDQLKRRLKAPPTATPIPQPRQRQQSSSLRCFLHLLLLLLLFLLLLITTLTVFYHDVGGHHISFHLPRPILFYRSSPPYKPI